MKNTTAMILRMFLALIVTTAAVSAQENFESAEVSASCQCETTSLQGEGSAIAEKAPITLGNNESILFLNASGANDGTEIRRFGGNALRFRYSGNAAVFDSLDNQAFQIRDPSGKVAFTIDPDSHAYFNNQGNVGIGRSPSPNVKLDIQDEDAVGIRFLRTDAKDARIMLGDPTKTWSMAVGWATPGDFSIIEELVAGNRLYIQQGGNVGISTSNPTERLEVNGNIKLNGSIVSNGDICIGSGCP